MQFVMSNHQQYASELDVNGWIIITRMITGCALSIPITVICDFTVHDIGIQRLEYSYKQRAVW